MLEREVVEASQKWLSRFDKTHTQRLKVVNYVEKCTI